MRIAIPSLSFTVLVWVAGAVAQQSAAPSSRLRLSSEADAAAAEAASPSTPVYMSSYTRLAEADTTVEAFKKLDADHDGRISALEAAANPRVAAAFTAGDRDKDGYLSLEEFQALSRITGHPEVKAASPSDDQGSERGEHQAAPPRE